MPIFIAYDFEGKVESVILAKNKELANVFWQGSEVTACSIMERHEEELYSHPTGVLPIVSTRLRTVEINNKPRDIRVIKKG